MLNYESIYKKGVCIWLTGLSAAGKSTTASALSSRIEELNRKVTLLDGDIIRTNLSKGLGFSKEDRDANILRIGFVASEIVKHGGIVICPCISPYKETRQKVREKIGTNQFIEIYIATPLHICEERDPKGLYKKARNGEIPHFTGIDDPYEPPVNPELALITTNVSIENNLQTIINFLEKRDLL